MYNVNLPLRLFQLALAVISVGMNGYVTKWYRAHTLTTVAPNSTMFMIGAGAFTILCLPYLFLNAPLRGGNNGRFFNKYAILALDLLNAGIWFGGFVSLAQFQARLLLCGGNVCQIMAGGAVVGAIEFATFVATAVLAGIHIARTRKGDQTAIGSPVAMAGKSHGVWLGGQVKA